GVVVRGGLVVATRADDDEQRHRDERAKDRDVEDGVVLHRLHGGVDGAPDVVHAEASCRCSRSSRISSAMGSSLRLAYQTYAMVIAKVVTNCPRPSSRPTLM